MTFLGFIQYLKKFMPNMADISASLRKLTEKDVEWKWTETEENSFNKLKKLATEAPVLRFYDPTLPLTLSVDSSSTSLGCVIVQEGQPIAYASRALTKMRQNYAQIEKETLAVVFGCEKFHQFVYGRTIEIETDHRPLQSIFNKPLQQVPARLQHFLLQLQKYDLQVTYKPGKYLHVADTLSRSYLQETKEQPGMSARIEETVAACALCAEHSRANAKEPLIPMEIPERPWVKVGADLFEFNNQHYLLIVDYFSK